MKNELLIPLQTLGFLEGIQLVESKVLSEKFGVEQNFHLLFYNTLLQSGIEKFVIFRCCKCDEQKIIEDRFGELPHYIRKRFKIINSPKSFFQSQHEIFHLFLDMAKNRNIKFDELYFALEKFSLLAFASKYNYAISIPPMKFNTDYFNQNFDQKILLPFQLFEKSISKNQKNGIQIKPSSIQNIDIVESIIRDLKYERYCDYHEKLKTSKFSLEMILQNIKHTSETLKSKHDELIKIKNITINTLDWTKSRVLEQLSPIFGGVANNLLKSIEGSIYSEKRLLYYNIEDFSADFLRQRMKEYIQICCNEHQKN